MDATAPSVLEKLSLGDTPQQEQDELTVPAPEATEAAETAPVPAGEAARRASSGDVDDAKDQLIATLTEELIATKADLARISKEREYYKRRAEWATTSDPQILSPVLTSADKWHDRTWLMLHEPIRQALLDFEDLVIKTPSFDPVKFPWKVRAGAAPAWFTAIESNPPSPPSLTVHTPHSTPTPDSHRSPTSSRI